MSDNGTAEMASKQVPTALLIDRQQRLASLLCVCFGATARVRGEEEERRRLSLHLFEGRFTVKSQATLADPEYLSDISGLWVDGGVETTVQQVLARLESAAGGAALNDETSERIRATVKSLRLLTERTASVVRMSSSATLEDWHRQYVMANRAGTP